MSNLLLKVKSLRIFTGEIHPTTLCIYDDYMVYIKRGIIRRNEATISYNHVSQVYLRKGYLTASLEVINTGGVENIEVKFLNKREAERAKRIIDQKVFQTHAKLGSKNTDLTKQVPDIERGLARLNELKNKNTITKGEFEKRKKEMLESL